MLRIVFAVVSVAICAVAQDRTIAESLAAFADERSVRAKADSAQNSLKGKHVDCLIGAKAAQCLIEGDVIRPSGFVPEFRTLQGSLQIDRRERRRTKHRCQCRRKSILLINCKSRSVRRGAAKRYCVRPPISRAGDSRGTQPILRPVPRPGRRVGSKQRLEFTGAGSSRCVSKATAVRGSWVVTNVARKASVRSLGRRYGRTYKSLF